MIRLSSLLCRRPSPMNLARSVLPALAQSFHLLPSISIVIICEAVNLLYMAYQQVKYSCASVLSPRLLLFACSLTDFFPLLLFPAQERNWKSWLLGYTCLLSSVWHQPWLDITHRVKVLSILCTAQSSLLEFFNRPAIAGKQLIKYLTQRNATSKLKMLMIQPPSPSAHTEAVTLILLS